MFLRKTYFLTPLFIIISIAALGQAASSPFSTFGIGEPYGNSLIQHQGMGGTGVSQPQFWSLNNQNPALLVFNYYYTVFQAGALLESRTISNDTLSQKSTNGNLAYLVTAFPIKPGKWTTSVGLMPFTKVNYKLSYDEDVYDNDDVLIDTMNVLERGSGGLTQFYWANGLRIHDNFSIGIKATYLFGSINTDYTNFIAVPNQPVPYPIGYNEQTYIKDFQFTGGASFSKDSIGKKQDLRFGIGMVYSFKSDLGSKKIVVEQRRLASGDPITEDTLVNRRGIISIPSSLTVGVSLSKGVRWSAAAEFSVQDWSKFKSISEEDEGLKKSWKASLGGEITPDPLSFNNYLKRMTYRVGFSYEKTPFFVDKSQLNDLGINFGFSMPAGRSSLDWAFRIGKRGDKSENILEETYYKIYFGITFNDQWFIKRKFD